MIVAFEESFIHNMSRYPTIHVLLPVVLLLRGDIVLWLLLRL
jgi:hypothetical protein